MSTFIIGSLLRADVQRLCLHRFVHRYTREHVPAWTRIARPDGTAYAVQFASDVDWLANTEFAVNKDGRLSSRYRYCRSTPTWPKVQP